jgi:hypothetical protein
VKWTGREGDPAQTTGAPTYIQPDAAMETLHVLGFGGTRLDPTTKAKLTKWCHTHNVITSRRGGHGILCYRTQPAETWLPEDLVVNISEIRAIDLGKTAPSYKQAKYRVLTGHRRNNVREYTDLDNFKGKTIVVLDSTIRDDYLRNSLADYANTHNAVAVIVAPSKRKAFNKANKCVDFRDYLIAEGAKAVKGCMVADMQKRYSRTHSIRGLYGVLPSEVSDPEVAALLTECQAAPKATWNSTDYDFLQALRGWFPLPALPELPAATWDERVQPVYAKYPHLTVGSELSSVDRLEILNALYYTRTIQTQTPATITNNQEQTK